MFVPWLASVKQATSPDKGAKDGRRRRQRVRAGIEVVMPLGITSEALIYRISQHRKPGRKKWATMGRGVEKQTGNESRGRGTEQRGVWV